VNYSSKLDSASTVDDVEGILNKFIPPGTPVPIHNHRLRNALADYFKDEESFLRRVGEDATSFQPSGQMIYSYSRPSPTSRRKEKSIVKSSPIYSESDDVITFEVYHVRSKSAA
jgi:histone acetyltransferase 1